MSENCTFMGCFCPKYIIFALKKYKAVVSLKMIYGSKFGEFSQK